jgi:hypothetical protein
MLAWQPLLVVGTDVLNAGINDTVSTELLYTVRVHIARVGNLDGKGLRRGGLGKHECAKNACRPSCGRDLAYHMY